MSVSLFRASDSAQWDSTLNSGFPANVGAPDQSEKPTHDENAPGEAERPGNGDWGCCPGFDPGLAL